MNFKQVIILVVLISLVHLQETNEWKKVYQNFSNQYQFQDDWNLGKNNYFQNCIEGPSGMLNIANNDYIFSMIQIPDHKKVKIEFDLYSINQSNIQQQQQQEQEIQSKEDDFLNLNYFYLFVDSERMMEISKFSLYKRTKNHICQEDTYINQKRHISYEMKHSSRLLQFNLGNIIENNLQNQQNYQWGVSNIQIFIDSISYNGDELLDGDSNQNFFQLWKKQQKQFRRELTSSTLSNSHSGSDSNNDGDTNSSFNENTIHQKSSNENSSGSDSNNDGTTDSSGPGTSSHELSSGSDTDGDGNTDTSGDQGSSGEISSNSDSNGDFNTDSSETVNGGHESSHEASSGSDSNGDGNSDSSIDLVDSSSHEDSSGSDTDGDGNTDSSQGLGSSRENSSGSDEDGDGNTDSSGPGNLDSSNEISSGSDSNNDGDTDSSGKFDPSSGEVSSGSDSDGDGNTDSSDELSSFSDESHSDSNHDGNTDSSMGLGSSQELSSGSDSDMNGDTDSSGIDGISSGEISETHSGSDTDGDGDTDSSEGPTGMSSGELSSHSDTNNDGNTDTSNGGPSSFELSSGSDSNGDFNTDSSNGESSGEVDEGCQNGEIEFGNRCFTQEQLQFCYNHLQLLDPSASGNTSINNDCEVVSVNGEYEYIININYSLPYYHDDTCITQELSFEGVPIQYGDSTNNYDVWSFDSIEQQIQFRIKHSDFANKYECEYKEIIKDGVPMYSWTCDVILSLYFAGSEQLSYSFKMCIFLDRTTVADNVSLTVYDNQIVGDCCENLLEVDSLLRFCTDRDCTEYVDTSLIPYEITRNSEIVVEHSIVTEEFIDYYLYTQQVRLGPFVPEITYYKGTEQGKTIIAFIASIASKELNIEVISMLDEIPSYGLPGTNSFRRSRVLQNNSQNNAMDEYKIKAKNVAVVNDNTFVEEQTLKMQEDKQQSDNQLYLTIAIFSGCIIIFIVGGLIYCKYLFNSHKKFESEQQKLEKLSLFDGKNKKNNKNNELEFGTNQNSQYDEENGQSTLQKPYKTIETVQKSNLQNSNNNT